MRGFGFKDNGFFICTETTPRCYVIQEVSDVSRAYSDINKNSVGNGENVGSNDGAASPYIPFLPWWFTSECRQQLLNVSSQGSFTPANSPYEPSNTPEPPGRLSPEQLYSRLKNQLEYYFSRENLMNDRYLRSQMDADQYVLIKTVAGFPKVSKLTNDFDLIVKVLKESNQVQVDESGLKARPSNKRCTIILREIPEDAKDEEVKSMFDGCVNYQSLTYGLNNSWYVTFANEEDTQKAFVHLQNIGKKFNNKPVYARIKTGGAPIVTDTYQFGAEDRITTNAGTAYKTNVGISPGGETIITGQITIHDVVSVNNESINNAKCHDNDNFLLGQILASYGYVPRASFRPSVTSTAAMNALQGSDSNLVVPAFSTPTVPASMPISVGGLQSKFLTPRTLNIKSAKSPKNDGKETQEDERKQPKPRNLSKNIVSLNQNKFSKTSYENKGFITEKKTQPSEIKPTLANNNTVNIQSKSRQGNNKWKSKEQTQPRSEKYVLEESDHQNHAQFGETDFPCLIEEEVKTKMTPSRPIKERVSFSSVVARREGPHPQKHQEEKKKTYAQTVKKSF